MLEDRQRRAELLIGHVEAPVARAGLVPAPLAGVLLPRVAAVSLGEHVGVELAEVRARAGYDGGIEQH